MGTWLAISTYAFFVDCFGPSFFGLGAIPERSGDYIPRLPSKELTYPTWESRKIIDSKVPFTGGDMWSFPEGYPNSWLDWSVKETKGQEVLVSWLNDKFPNFVPACVHREKIHPFVWGFTPFNPYFHGGLVSPSNTRLTHKDFEAPKKRVRWFFLPMALSPSSASATTSVFVPEAQRPGEPWLWSNVQWSKYGWLGYIEVVGGI